MPSFDLWPLGNSGGFDENGSKQGAAAIEVLREAAANCAERYRPYFFRIRFSPKINQSKLTFPCLATITRYSIGGLT